MKQQLDYWRRQLEGAPPELALPTDRPRRAVPSHNAGHCRFKVSQATTQGLQALAARHEASLFAVLAAAFAAWLHRHTGQQDICFATPASLRSRPEFAGMAGFFVNLLVLRSHVDGQQRFNELLQSVKQTLADAHAHRDVPFEKVVQALNPQRDGAGLPLANVTLSLAKQPLLPRSSLKTELVPIRPPCAKTDLTLELVQQPQGLDACIDYRAELFDESTIQRMAERFNLMLNGIVADERMRVDDLPLMSADERRRVLVDWNRTEHPQAPQPTLLDLLIHPSFEAQARQHPDATALVHEGRQLSYRELNERANRIAHRLLALRVRPDDRIALCIEQGFDLVAGVLGILKAGAAYVPLDPRYPPARLAFLLADSAPAAVLTHAALRARLPASEAPVIELDRDDLSREPVANPDPLSLGLTSSHLAYVIYTSGSTGRPKGVAVAHGGFVNLMAWMMRTFAFPADAPVRNVLMTSLSFDLTQKNIFFTLATGGTLSLPSDHRDLAEVLALIRQQQATLINCTPSAFLGLLHADDGTPGLASLRFVLLGGEPVNPQALREHRRRHPAAGTTFFNTYGPTECTDVATACPVPESQERAPIGRPLPNVRAYILNSRLQPVPIGAVGELCIGGVGVARGYWNRADLTEQRFLPDPFADHPEARMYLTGDLARWLPDGHIEFLGRRDGQVKIRGFRIEPGEIEAALRAQPGIADACVVTREDARGELELVAYVVPLAGTAAPSGLRERLGQCLPPQLLPAHIVALAKLPLNPNGKLDRLALPAPTQGDQAPCTAPRTPTEMRLVALWRELLQSERVGVDDDFFRLGGHSLLAMRLAAHVRAVFGIKLPVRTLFEAPTVATLAAWIDGHRAITDAAQPITPCPHEGPLPLSFGQRRLWFLHCLAPDSALYHMPLPLRLSGALDLHAMQRAWHVLTDRHEILRTTITVLDGEPFQAIAPDASPLLAFTDLTMLPTGEQSLTAQALVEAETGAAFDLTHGPLLRGRLMRLDARTHLLVLVLHHIVGDGWSLHLLLRDLLALYGAMAAGRPLPPAPSALRYADFAHWQRQQLTPPRLAASLDYWQRQLADAPGGLDLPADRPRPAAPSYRGARIGFEVPEPVARGLQAFTGQTRTTLFMLLAAAFNALLYRYTGQADLCIGTPVAGRTRPEFEAVVGFFVNTLALRTRIDGEAPFLALLEQVRETALNAYAHQDVPFDQVVEAVNPPRHASHMPLFQTMFAWQNLPMDALDEGAPGLSVELAPLKTCAAPFDLVLEMMEHRGLLTGSFVYSTDLFDAETIERMASHFGTLLAGIAADPRCSVDKLPLMSAQERQQLLVGWNATAQPVAPELTAHALFEAQARKTPELTALESEGRRLSYAELDAQANRLARWLRAQGVAPDTLVGLCMTRSIDAVVGILGVLKAGGAYLPLAPAHPASRIAGMLADANCTLVLTQRRLRDLPALDSVATACVDADGPWSTLSPDPLAPAAQPQNLAYVIYTSGSTGQPKGVAVEHRNLVHLALAQAEAFGIGPADRVLHTLSLNFDASVSEIFMALTQGATLVPAPEHLLPGDGLEDLLQAARITAASLPPPLLRALPDMYLPHLHTLIVGGEACEPALVRRWAPGRRFFNVYGPTETTVIATCHRCDPQDDRPPPIGRPLANTRLYILDPRRQPVPVGVTGELWIGGAGVARGYLNRPELSTERFTADPFCTEPGQRMYRSGDLARWRADGTVECLGRIDQQVKVNGLRIELGEIEAALRALPDVADAAVTVWSPRPGDSRLVAYAVARAADNTPPLPSLRDPLRRTLPDGWLPAQLVWLQQLPRTATGKLDRQALPEPLLRTAGRELSTATERALHALWAELLETRDLHADSDFFEAGGSSLLAMKLLHRIKLQWGLDLAPHLLYERPRLADLAQAIDEAASPGQAAWPRTLLQDAVLPPDVQPLSGPPAEPPRRVLLTGANGFLGCFLLHALLERGMEVVCLVRAPTNAQARHRLAEAAQRYGLPGFDRDPRVQVLAADLAQPGFGLHERVHNELCVSIDAIFHNAAQVHHLYDYERLRDANVTATLALLRWAAAGRPKAFHYVSTLSAASVTDIQGRRLETGPAVDPAALPHNGYVLSKWAAERLVWQAGERGLSVAVYRPGNVAGHSRTGVCSPQGNRTLMAIRDLLRLGIAPDVDLPFDMTPVDHVADAIASLSMAGTAEPRAYHLLNPHQFSTRDYFSQLRGLGYALHFVGGQDLRRRLRDAADAGAWINERDFESEDLRFACDKTQLALRTLGIACPPPAALIHANTAFLQAVGFLAPPDTMRTSPRP